MSAAPACVPGEAARPHPRIPRVFAAVVLLAVLVAAVPASAKTYAILTGEWPPYVSEKLPGGGPLGRVVCEALEAVGDSASLHFLPWPRVEAAMLSGEGLATFPWAPIPQFEGVCKLSAPLARQRVVLFFLEERLPGWDYPGLDGLAELRVGGSRGYVYVEMFAKAGIQADFAPDIASSLSKLLSDRVDVVPENEVVGWSLIRSQFAAQAHRVSSSRTPMYTSTLHLVVSATHPDGQELLARFEQGLRLLKDSGRYRRLIEEGGLPLDTPLEP